MNYLWRPSSSNFGMQFQVLTDVFVDDYCHPRGFLVGDNYATGDYIETDKTLTSYQAQNLMYDLITFIHEQHENRLG
jgi:hypothetical protein